MDDSLRDALAAAEDRHWWFEGRRRIIASVMTGLNSAGPIAEIGCGNGANLQMLSAFGPVTGVEPDEGDRFRASRREVGTVVAGALPNDLPLSSGSFETVLALDVIEHVKDDVAAVRAMESLLKPGGHLIITVPAYPWLWSAHDEVNAHFRRYTRGSLKDTLASSDLRLVKLSYFNMFLLPLVALVRTAGRYLGLDGAGTSVPSGLVNRGLMKLLASESRLLARFPLPAGVSLLAVVVRD